jgi:hypothetical protein
MTIEITAAVLLGGLALWLILQPLYRPESVGPEFEEPEDPEETKRGIALIALKEIDFDRATGKLSDVDYEFLRQKYTAEALQAIREEEGHAGTMGMGETVGAATASLRCPRCGPRPEHDAKFCSDCGTALVDSRLCHVCHAPFEPASRFCSNCGSQAPA